MYVCVCLYLIYRICVYLKNIYIHITNGYVYIIFILLLQHLMTLRVVVVNQLKAHSQICENFWQLKLYKK